MTTNSTLADRCTRVADLTREALAWTADPENAELVGPERKSLTRLMRQSLRRATKLAAAARSRMSVSVFGPSQAGKSFLVSVLARPEGGRLVARFNGPGGELDYISEINPEGEGESTGLVTRFTMVSDPTPDGFPIRLVLLSESDIARTLSNSFFMDGDQGEPMLEPEQVGAHVAAYRARAGAERPGLTADDVRDIADYVAATFGRTAYAEGLKGFWEDAADIAPGLSPEDRAAFLAPIWGGHSAFSALYVQLARALARIGHAEEVFVGLDALTPRETSIIDVKALHRLAGGDGPLRLRTRAGQVTDLPRAELCALAAELVMPMRDRPSPLFDQVDLLDFPGARNRFKKPLSATLSEPARTIPELLLRGKVAYLFDRYVERQEITSMLLCVPDSNMETVDLPGLVETWIGMTHGPRPADRDAADCILFFVLTKFDKHLGDSAADGGTASRFERRMQASLIEKFGQSRADWVDRWTPETPFRNCYWLRNPNFYVEGLIEYAETPAGKREVQVRPEKVGRIAELQQGCLSAPLVARHFADPVRAWNAAMALNDGGVGYLTEDLARVCKPDSKDRQIKGQLRLVETALARAVAPFHVDDDIERRIEVSRANAHAVIDGLETALQRQKFGALMAALMVDQDAVEDAIARVPPSVRITAAVSSAQGAVPLRPGADGPVRPGRPLRPAAPAAQAPEPAVQAVGDPQGIRAMTLEQFQAETALEVWVDRLKQFRDDARGLEVTGLGAQPAADLAAELIHAARRGRLAPRIAEDLRAISFGLTVDRQAHPAAILCAERINRFVATLGADALPPAERPQVPLPDGGSRPAFPVRAAADDVSRLPALPRRAAEDHWTDWVFSLESMFVANAMDTDAGTLNIEQNLRLGRILGGLSGSAA
jgi:hypothetical protein